MLAESLLALSTIDVKPVETGLSAPTSVATAPNGTLFVTEKGGRIVKIQNGKPRTWYRITVSDEGERGLLSMVRINKKRFYAAYTDAKGALQVSRFTKGGGERKIIRIPHPRYTNHNGGQLQLHKGLLYVSTGDGGGSGDPFGAAGKVSDLRGKILRIDPTCGSKRYCIPASNPRAGSPVIAYGLRNPWRFSIDAATDEVWIGDVGQNSVEEIDRMRIDAPLTDFGWSCFEGRRSYDPDRCAGRDVTAPILTYGRNEGGSVTGGYVYRGTKIPKLRGWYVFGDFVSGRLWAYKDGTRKRIGRADGVTSFGVDQRGELLLTTISGRVLRITK